MLVVGIIAPATDLMAKTRPLGGMLMVSVQHKAPWGT